MISYETIAAIWLLVGVVNVLLTAGDPETLNEGNLFEGTIYLTFLAAGPLLLVFAAWGFFGRLCDSENTFK